MRWPDGFMWGTGASSTQCEGAAPASDWWDWERAGHAPLSGDGNGFAARYAEDFRAARRASGCATTGCRSSGRGWSPSRAAHDRAAVGHYRDMLAAALAAGVVPWVCLHHFTLPRWFAAAGGFLVEPNRTEVWTRHVEFVAETFGDLVGGWQPVNETNYYALAAYRGGGWPPGRNDPAEAMLVSTRHPPRDRGSRGAAAPDRRAGRVDLRAVGHRDFGRRSADCPRWPSGSTR